MIHICLPFKFKKLNKETMRAKPISKVLSYARRKILVRSKLEKMLEEIEMLTNIIKQVNDKTRHLNHDIELAILE